MRQEAVASAMASVEQLETALHEDLHLEILTPVAEVLMAAGSPEEQRLIQSYLQLFLAMTAQRTLDEEIRVRWFRGPVGRRLVELAGSLDAMAMQPPAADGGFQMDQSDVQLLAMLTEGLTNGEIATRLGQDEVTVARRLGEMFARIGAPTRSEATAFAFREQVV